MGEASGAGYGLGRRLRDFKLNSKVTSNSTKVADSGGFFSFSDNKRGYSRVNPPKQAGEILAVWGVQMFLALGLLCLLMGYAAVFVSFWCLCRMTALTDKFVKARANVIPFQRGELKANSRFFATISRI